MSSLTPEQQERLQRLLEPGPPLPELSDVPIVSQKDYIRCVVNGPEGDTAPMDGNVVVTRPSPGALLVQVYDYGLVAEFMISDQWARKLALALTVEEEVP